MFRVYVVLLLSVLLVLPCASLSVSNSLVSISFDDQSHYALQQISNLAFDPPYAHLVKPASRWWSIAYVRSDNTDGTINTMSTALSNSSQRTVGTTSVTDIRWTNIDVTAGTVNVTAHVTLQQTDSFASFSFDIEFAPNAGQTIALWTLTIDIDSVNAFSDSTDQDDTVLVLPEAFGRAFVEPSIVGPASWSGSYPYGYTAYQFVTVYHTQVKSAPVPPPSEYAPPSASFAGLYFATHDPTAAAKTFTWSMNNTAHTQSVGVVLFSTNAGQPLPQPPLPFPVNIGVYTGDYFDAASIYRQWVLSSAPWAAHSIRNRTDFPLWYLNNQLWVNSGWQQLDIFNRTQGDPAVVMQRLTTLYHYLNISAFALHWYEWNVPLFDTGYPDYFPTRDGFAKTVIALQSDLNISVVPYINGRCYDTGISRWSQDNAIRFAAKNSNEAFKPTDLQIYSETYGSGSTFAVMCPHTDYWQDIIADLVNRLTNQYGVHGVYIDQVGAANPKRCFDPTHNHTVGDGSHWVSGYDQLFTKVNGQLPAGAMIITEGCAESYMHKLHGYLTLDTFGMDISGPTFMVPVYSMVYGGYYQAVGAEWFQSDFTTPNIFKAKLAQMFIHGAQLGWFSLGGTSHDKMGVYELMIDPKYAPLMEWLTMLVQWRTSLALWMIEGRQMRPAPFTVQTISTANDSTSDRRTRSAMHEESSSNSSTRPTWTIPTVMHTCWLWEDQIRHSENTFLFLFINPINSIKLQFIIDLSYWNVQYAQNVTFAVFSRDLYGNRKQLGQYQGVEIVYISDEIPQYSVTAIEIRQTIDGKQEEMSNNVSAQ